MEQAIAIQDDVEERQTCRHDADEVIDAFDHVIEALDQIYDALAQFADPQRPEATRH